MRVTLREETISLLEAEAVRRNLAPEELIRKIVELHLREEEPLQSLTYAQLLDMSKNGSKNEKVTASKMRARFIR